MYEKEKSRYKKPPAGVSPQSVMYLLKIEIYINTVIQFSYEIIITGTHVLVKP